jgi:hypothetical protein
MRTRLIDYLWGRLPVITSGGDVISHLITSRGCGLKYDPGNPHSLALTIENVLNNPEVLAQTKEKIETLLQSKLNTAKVISPLNEYLNDPWINKHRKTPFSIGNILTLLNLELIRRYRELI